MASSVTSKYTSSMEAFSMIALFITLPNIATTLAPKYFEDKFESGKALFLKTLKIWLYI